MSKPLLVKMVLMSDIVYEFSVSDGISVDRTFVTVVSAVAESDDSVRKARVEFRKTDE